MLVGTLLTVLTLGVLQFGLAIYVRNVVHDAAVEGAYHAALADTSLAEGAQRTREIVARTVGAEYAADVDGPRDERARAPDRRGHGAHDAAARRTARRSAHAGGDRACAGRVVRLSRAVGRRCRDERGSAALEFILVGLLLLVPLVYLVVALGLIQGQSLGAEAGARHIARAVSTAADAAMPRDARGPACSLGRRRVRPRSRTRSTSSLACRPPAATCPAAGATLVVTVRTRSRCRSSRRCSGSIGSRASRSRRPPRRRSRDSGGRSECCAARSRMPASRAPTTRAASCILTLGYAVLAIVGDPRLRRRDEPVPRAEAARRAGGCRGPRRRGRLHADGDRR